MRSANLSEPTINCHPYGTAICMRMSQTEHRYRKSDTELSR